MSEPKAPPRTLATLDLAPFTMSEMDAAGLDALDDAVVRLARAYSTTPPQKLLPEVQIRLNQVDALLRRRVTLAQHTRLFVAAGWLHLLLAALHYDLGQREAAHVSRDVALYIAEQGHEPDIAGWAFETPAWFALTEGRPHDAQDLAVQGRKIAPRGSSADIMNTMKIAVARAQLGDRSHAVRALDEGAALVAAMPLPEHPDHHFVFDPPKFSHYASQVYALLGVHELVEEHARTVIRESGNPRSRTWVTTRVANARLDLGASLLAQRRLDEAVGEASKAFDSFMRHDTILRAADLDSRLSNQYPTARETRDFHERLLVAGRSLYSSSYKRT